MPIERVAARALTVLIALLIGCARGPAAGPATAPSGFVPVEAITAAEVERQLRVLAHDSLEGRQTGTAGERAAARFIAAEMQWIGLQPGGDSGLLQRVPLLASTRNGRTRLRLALPDSAGIVPPGDTTMAWNVIGIIPGTDPALRDEVVVVGAHLDHVGTGNPVAGDSIYNGADDDASGVVAVLGIAAAIRAGPAPKRTLVFAAFTGEEMGLLGTRWYIAHPTHPIERTVANLQVEMIGRPDSLAGGAGKGWLTGYERSTMGDILREAGSAIIPDPRPDQNFFMRSDNIAFARLGIPAHTLSSFNLHTDYHRPSDEADAVDFAHMTAVIRAAADMVRHLADGPRPEWHPGGRP